MERQKRERKKKTKEGGIKQIITLDGFELRT